MENCPAKSPFIGISAISFLSILSFSANFFQTPKYQKCPIPTMSEPASPIGVQ
jgi:hypothetical protein